ncbi:unnamed protein product [Adineta steineri]|uniref:Uncharacterized protein n=1 Tax=Adineta steineri TaxID=433720 RepID=A0A815AU04_9BILA|nr:unnamed protein product [Adineta steineri]
MPLIHDTKQLVAIYIFCGNKVWHEEWAKKWSKIQGVFTEIEPICDSMKALPIDSISTEDNDNLIKTIEPKKSDTTKSDSSNLDSTKCAGEIVNPPATVIIDNQVASDDQQSLCEEGRAQELEYGNKANIDDKEHENESKVDETEHGNKAKVDDKEDENETKVGVTEHGNGAKADDKEHGNEAKVNETEHENEVKAHNKEHGNEAKMDDIEHKSEAKGCITEHGNETKPDDKEHENEAKIDDTEHGIEAKVEGAEHANEAKVECTECDKEADVQEDQSSEHQEFDDLNNCKKLRCEGRPCAKCHMCRDWHFTGDQDTWTWITNCKNRTDDEWKRFIDDGIYKNFTKRDGATCYLRIALLRDNLCVCELH